MPQLRLGSEGDDYFTAHDPSSIGFGAGDTLVGLGGDDRYSLRVEPGAIIEEVGGGFDTVVFGAATDPFVSTFIIPANVEMAGWDLSRGQIHYGIHGNSIANLIDVQGFIDGFVGPSYDTTLRNAGFGNDGDDFVRGIWGTIRLDGGAGNDILKVTLDFRAGWNRLDAVAEGGTGSDTLHVNTMWWAGNGPHPGMLLRLDTPGAAQSIGATQQISLSGLENIWLERSLADTLIGNDQANLLIGGMDGDYLLGAGGADTLRGSNTPWHVTPSFDQASDLIPDARIANENRDDFGSINSADGADTLDGGTGADVMIGGRLSDLYRVDNTADVLVELAGEGDADRVESRASFILPDHVEHLSLLGTAGFGAGNGAANIVLGNNGANTLSGLAGADSLAGGNGNDLLLGGSEADTLSGGAGADTLDGGAGVDRMSGGLGDDSYVVDDLADRVTEKPGEGFDTVRTALAAYVLPVETEALVLLAGAVRGVGNASDNLLLGNDAANQLYGNAGADTLVGGGGRDTLDGGDGADVFRLFAPGEGPDFILGFVPGSDRIEVSAAGFGAGLVVAGSVAGRFFLDLLPPATPAGAFLYDSFAGKLYWDANGSLAGGRFLLATLDGAPALAATDLAVIA